LPLFPQFFIRTASDLAQGALQPVQDPFAARPGPAGYLRCIRQSRGQLLQEAALFFREPVRHENRGDHDEVTSASCIMDIWDALPLESKGLAGLDTGGQTKLVITIQCWDGYITAQSGLSDVEGEPIEEMDALPLKDLTWGDVEADIKVPRRAVVGASLTLTAHANTVAIINASGNGHADGAHATYAAGATAFLTGLCDDPALAATATTGADVHILAEEALLTAAYLTGPFTGGARLWL
jgi:hypothetical protein